MSLIAWSWVLSGLNLVGLYLSWQVGNKRRWVWLMYVGVEGVWIVYAFDTGSWGFVVSALAYAAVAIRNYVRWGRDALGTTRPLRASHPSDS